MTRNDIGARAMGIGIVETAMDCKIGNVYENSKVAVPPLLTETYHLVRLMTSGQESSPTYCATSGGLDTIAVVFSSCVFTVTTDITCDFDGIVQSAIWVGWNVGEERDEGDAIRSLADTSVHRCPVTQIGSSGSPAASICNRSSLRVDIVLCSGRRSLPRVVAGRVYVCQRVSSSSLGVKRNGLTLRARIISAADSNILFELVFNLDASCTLNANLGN